MSIIRLKKTDRPTYKRDNNKSPERRVQERLERKITSICEQYKDGMSLRQIAAIHRTSHETIRQILKNHRIPIVKERELILGNKRTDTSGYIHVFVGVGFPGATRLGWILEHRLVMQEHLGRPLMFWEIIHHKDRDKANNKLENLEVTNSAEHSTCLRCPYYEYYVAKTGKTKISVET